jgi:hypothetical protein
MRCSSPADGCSLQIVNRFSEAARAESKWWSGSWGARCVGGQSGESKPDFLGAGRQWVWALRNGLDLFGLQRCGMCLGGGVRFEADAGVLVGVDQDSPAVAQAVVVAGFDDDVFAEHVFGEPDSACVDFNAITGLGGEYVKGSAGDMCDLILHVGESFILHVLKICWPVVILGGGAQTIKRDFFHDT